MNARDIFLAAVERPAAERPTFLDSACAGDVELRRRVEALLRAHDDPGSLLDRPAADPDATLPPRPGGPTAAAAAPQQVGPYRLVQKLGEGGMGEVWVAEQEQPVKRRVALKLIRPGMGSDRIIARFEAERQALAIMDHTNIAKVLDAGTTESGRPYFVMELIKGVPITTYCDELNLPVRQRLELFVPVCRAVQHAHQKGIIHRDIKPSNVLVAVQDGKPVPKVIDFGVAKAISQKLTERSMMTEFGALVGTLEYMSPEQAELSELDIDTRADVYALGVLLYELLTGTPPLDREQMKTAAIFEVLRIIRQDEPPKPSTRLSSSSELPSLAARRRTSPAHLAREVRGELDWIVMRCLEKDRQRRYETADALARDVERHLADELVEAGPPSARYRLQKWLRRNHKAVATLAAFWSFALLMLAYSGFQSLLANDARANLRSEEQRAQRRLNQAQAAAMTIDEANSFVRYDLLGVVDRSKRPDPDMKVRTALDRAAERLKDRYADRPLVEASARVTLGTSYRALGLYQEAQTHLGAACDLYRRELERLQAADGDLDPDFVYYQYLLGALRRRADLFRDLSQPEKAAQIQYFLESDAKSLWGGALAAERKLASAEPLLLEGYHGLKACEKNLADDEKVRVTEALERLVRLYEGWGKKDEAAKWRAELEALKKK